MFEYARRGGRATPAHPAPDRTAPPKRAFLFWAEHCTECAAPDCYRSCDLYQARPDLRCRRFEEGIVRNPTFPGAGAEVVFKRWGKIEARGNARLLPSRLVRTIELAVGAARPILDLGGRLLGRITRDDRWAGLSASLLDRLNARLLKSAGPLPHAFVAEIYNPGDRPVALLFTAAVDRPKLGRGVSPRDLPPPVVRRFTVPPGYFREELPGSAFAALVGSALAFSMALAPEAGEGAHLVFLALDFLGLGGVAGRLIERPQGQRPAAKCVVFDLDNTLWDGILLEGEVSLRPGVADTIRALDERGILVSVASKNAASDAMAQLTAFGLADYVLRPSIGWGPKSEGLRRIADELDIGTDTLIFLDDNPFERDEVRSALPGVETLPDTALPDLLRHPRLQGALTAESRSRRQIYRQALARESAAEGFGSDYKAFLRACDLRVEVRRDRREDVERIGELVQRTNQLNFSGRKYARDEVERLLAAGEWDRHVVSCADRYGSYGLVGFCLSRRTGGGVWIEDLMLSCRVQGKYVEHALLQVLAQEAGSPEFIELNFVPTDRNAAARAVLEELGFVKSDGGMRLEPVPVELAPDFLTIEAGDAEPLAAE